MTGLSLALGVAVGLFNRERTGRGHLISTSLLGNGIAGMGYDLAGALATQADFDPEPRESREPMILAYSTSDGRWLNLCLMPPDKYWPSLSKAIGRPELADDPRYASFAARQQHSDEVRELLEAAFATRPLADWNDVLDYHGISWAPVRSLGEVISDEQAIVNDYFITYKHETYGPVRGVAGPVQFEGYPPAPHQAPEFGQHTEETLLDAGYDWGDISEFRQDGVI